MTSIYIAGNYIDGSDNILTDGFGHLQVVYGDDEIEVQAPTEFYTQAVLAGLAAGGVSGAMAGALVGFAFGSGSFLKPQRPTLGHTMR